MTHDLFLLLQIYQSTAQVLVLITKRCLVVVAVISKHQVAVLHHQDTHKSTPQHQTANGYLTLVKVSFNSAY